LSEISAVEALEWLIQLFDGKGLEWRDDGLGLPFLAAKRGKLASLTCLHANGCPWDMKKTCLSAAAGGHLDVLQWARQNGRPWSTSTETKLYNEAMCGRLNEEYMTYS
jgi:hypothetical protein